MDGAAAGGLATSGLATALELAELGARMVEAKFRREHPDATDQEVAARVNEWWSDRPGAPHGDCPGRSIPVDEAV